MGSAGQVALGLLVGALTGVISGFGIGGGSLLVLYLTAVAGVEQLAAQGINLVYFLFCAPTALWSHIRNGLVQKKAALICAAAGVAASVATALAAGALDGAWLRRGFGVLLLYIGIKELLAKGEKTQR